MSILKFCRVCNNILYPKEDKERKILLYVCGNCEHQEEADDNCVYKCEIKHSNGEHSQVLQDIAVDPNLPRTKSVRCAVCNHPEAVFFKHVISILFGSVMTTLKQTGCDSLQATPEGEEGMALYFVCCNPSCGHRWRD